MSQAGMTSWSTLVGHQKIASWFRTAIQQGRLGGSFLLVGSPGIGKRTVANLLARTLLCESSDPQEMNPCGKCQACVQVEAETHPDVVRVSKPDDKSFIPLELLIGPSRRTNAGGILSRPASQADGWTSQSGDFGRCRFSQ